MILCCLFIGVICSQFNICAGSDYGDSIQKYIRTEEIFEEALKSYNLNHQHHSRVGTKKDVSSEDEEESNDAYDYNIYDNPDEVQSEESNLSGELQEGSEEQTQDESKEQLKLMTKGRQSNKLSYQAKEEQRAAKTNPSHKESQNVETGTLTFSVIFRNLLSKVIFEKV